MNVRLNHFVQRTLLVTYLGLGICIIFVLLVSSMSFVFICLYRLFINFCISLLYLCIKNSGY